MFFVIEGDRSEGVAKGGAVKHGFVELRVPGVCLALVFGPREGYSSANDAVCSSKSSDSQ